MPLGKVIATEAERAAVIAAAVQHGFPAEEVNAAVSIESGWRAGSYHPVSKAVGLIGFMPFILRKLGYSGSPESFGNLSAGEQAPWVGKYFAHHAGRWRVPGDTYLALAAPAFLGSPDSRIAYPKGGKAWEINPGWRGPDGEITVGSIRAVLLRKMRRLAAKGGGSISQASVSPEAPSSPLAFAALALGAYLLYRWIKGKKKRHDTADYQRAD